MNVVTQSKTGRGAKSALRSTLFLLALLLSALVAEASQLKLAWDANKEPEVTGYKVHIGTVKGAYSHVMDVGNTTAAEVSDLEEATTYFFAVTAYTSDGTESPLSNEVAYNTLLKTGSLPAATLLATKTSAGFSALFATKAGKTYSIEYTDTLTNPTWVPLASGIGDGSVKSVTDSTTEPSRFYRMIVGQ